MARYVYCCKQKIGLSVEMMFCVLFRLPLIDEWTLWSFDFWSNGKNNGHRKKYEAERTGSCLKASQRKRRKSWNQSHSTTTNENNWFWFLLVCVWNQKSGDRWKSGQRWFDCLYLSLALPLSLWLSLCYQLFLTVVSSWLIFWIVIWFSLGKKKIGRNK